MLLKSPRFAHHRLRTAEVLTTLPTQRSLEQAADLAGGGGGVDDDFDFDEGDDDVFLPCCCPFATNTLLLSIFWFSNPYLFLILLHFCHAFLHYWSPLSG
jgi:hypothetical protein